MAIESPLGPIIANVFLSFYEVKWLELCQINLSHFFIEDMLMAFLFLFESVQHILKFRDYFNAYHLNMPFSFEQEKNGKLPFLDIEVPREKWKLATTVYRKPTFCGVYTHFESFLATIHKFGMVYTLACCCFKICPDWTNFHEELSFLKQVF